MRKFSIDVRQKYAVLSTGEIEPLYFENGEPREIERDGTAVYLIRDVSVCRAGADGTEYFCGWALHRDQIICTADRKGELRDIAMARATARKQQKDYGFDA